MSPVHDRGRRVSTSSDGLMRVLAWVYHRTPRPIARMVFRSTVPTHVLGAACVIERDDGRILLVRQPRPDRKWTLPGGVVDLWEQPATAAVREAREEVGLEVQLTSEAAVIFESNRNQIHVIYRAQCPDGVDPESARPVSGEISEIRWVTPEEAARMPHVIEGALVELDRQRPRGADGKADVGVSGLSPG